MSYFGAASERYRAGEHPLALKLFLAAIDAGDNAPQAHACIAAILGEQRKLDAALVHASKAVAGEPENIGFLTTLGNTLYRMDRFAEARGPLTMAASSDAPHAGVWYNLGLLEYADGNYPEAVRHMEHAQELDPENKRLTCDRAMALMANGQWEAGFDAFEARWTTLRKSLSWQCGAPMWDGQPLDGKRILVHHEQGTGDTIQFMRYVPLLRRAHRAVVDFAVPRALFPVASHLGAELVDIDEPQPLDVSYDYHCPLLSLPRLTGVMPTRALKPYLHPRMVPHPRLKRLAGEKAVGIVWAGAPGYEADLRRSTDVRNFIALTMVRGVRLYSLQVGPRAGDLAQHGLETLITDLAPQIHDWGDTADLVSQLDAVVSVDTSTLHLAAAMGKPVIGLLAYMRCWRWSADWYPHLTLLKQPSPGDWGSVIAGVAQLLAPAACEAVAA